LGRLATIRKHAPLLLEASKEALRLLVDQDPHPVDSEEAKRQKVLTQLREAINAADPPNFDERNYTVRLVMTHGTWKALHDILVKRAKSNRDDEPVLEAAEEGVRFTKQRVYVTLDLDHSVLRRLQFVLRHSKTTAQEKSFQRLAKQIGEEGLSKNPMELLAEQGL